MPSPHALEHHASPDRTTVDNAQVERPTLRYGATLLTKPAKAGFILKHQGVVTRFSWFRYAVAERFDVRRHQSGNPNNYTAPVNVQRHVSILALIVALALLPRIAPVRAQDRLAYGQTVQGQITRDSFRQIFAFQGREGDIIEATLARTDGTLDPVLILTDADNMLIAINDDGAGNYNATISALRLERDGLYFLIATRFGQDRGNSIGRFSLSLARVGIASNAGRPGGTVLQYGDSVVNQIDTATWQHLYAFSALRGEVISVRMQRISGDLDPLLILADSQGNVLISSDDDPNSPGTLDAAIYGQRIQRTGNYVIIATRFGQEPGPSSGGFSLRLEKVGAEQIGLSAEFAELLDPGVLVTGSISKDLLRRFYLIEAKAGDTLTVEARRVRGNLDPVLELRSADGLSVLVEHDSGARGINARISAYQVLRDGTYIIVVSRFNRETGITAGDYSLLVTVNRSP